MLYALSCEQAEDAIERSPVRYRMPFACPLVPVHMQFAPARATARTVQRIEISDNLFITTSLFIISSVLYKYVYALVKYPSATVFINASS
jgi:hypothetical protein